MISITEKAREMLLQFQQKADDDIIRVLRVEIIGRGEKGFRYDLNLVDKLIGIKNFKNKIDFNTYPSLEAQISAISDDIAYNNHDIQDGIRAKLFNLNDLLDISFFKEMRHPCIVSKCSWFHNPTIDPIFICF